MMNRKKLLALLLAVVMVVGMFPMGAMAQETEPSVPETTETVTQTTEAAAQIDVDPCEVCNTVGCTATHVQCTNCGTWDCKTQHETQPTPPATEPNATEPKTTEPKETEPKATEPKETEPKVTEPKETTPTTPNTPVEKCGICEGDHKTDECKACAFCKSETCTCVTCEECGVKNDHTSTCTKRPCEKCEKTPCECETEPTETTEETTEATVVLCENCGMEDCVCELEDLYLLKGAEIYKNYQDSSETPKTIDKWNTSIKVKQTITEEDGTVWYEFAYTSFWADLFNEYKFVKTEDTTELECTCNTETLTHNEECFLYEADITDPIEYRGTTSSGISTTVMAAGTAFPEGTVMTVKDTSVDMGTIDAVVNGASKFMLRRSAPVNSVEILGVKAVDINFGGEQPSEPVQLAISIPASGVPAEANQAIIVHIGENGPEKVGGQYLQTNVDNHVVTATVNGFSTYCVAFVNGKYNATKMRDLLQGNDRYSVVDSFKVDLFDYDPVKINAALDSLVNGTNMGFHFTGYGVTGCSSNSGINNSAAGFAKQGILYPTLQNGFPSINYLNGSTSPVVNDAGINTGKLLFDDTYAASGKTIYKDIPFEIIYDKQTGYYEYKSSANHAQLNDAKNKIEIYADTLAMQNASVKVDLSESNGNSEMVKNGGYKNSKYVGTATWRATDNRLDPYIYFNKTVTSKIVNGVESYNISEATSNVEYIYVKMKVPAAVGQNRFAIFFSTEDGSWSEQRTFRHEYTANGDWLEFVIDTGDKHNYENSTNNWTGKTITGLRIDPFDSNGGTLDRTKEYDFEIAEISLIYGTDTVTTNGGFYPFSDIRESYPGNNDPFNYNRWTNQMQEQGLTIARGTRSVFNPTSATAQEQYDELCYGMVMEYDFYLPVDKTGENLTYYFNGDDDLWVFVDGKLVLDIGGGHGAITGMANFTTGAVEVSAAQTVTGYNSGISGETGTKKTTQMDENLFSPGKHTMKIFYLERGGSVSNCYMKYNLPQTPTGSVIVSKAVSEEQNADISELIKQTFEFTIEVEGKGSGGQAKAPYANKDFFIIDNNKNETYVSNTNADGVFLLKHNQEAVFEIDENHQVYVTETEKSIEGYVQVSVKVNDKEQNHLDELTGKGTSIRFDFVNTYNETDVHYTYIPVNPDGCPDDKKGTVELTGDTISATYAETGVSEEVGVVVFDPVGSSATDNATVKFAGWYSDEGCTNLVTTEKVIVPENPIKNEDGSYSGRTYYAKFEYKYGNLKIEKTGIQSVDHDAIPPVEEQQSTIYVISGTSSNGTEINMEVAIVGNSSVTVKDLPVGSYNVKEKNAWSWRYNPESNERTVEVVGNQTAVTEFNNIRNKPLWLSGDCNAKNRWGSDNIVATGLVDVTNAN